MILFIDAVWMMSRFDIVNLEAGGMPLYILRLGAYTVFIAYESFSPTSLIMNTIALIYKHEVSIMNKMSFSRGTKNVLRSRNDVPNCSPTVADDNRARIEAA